MPDAQHDLGMASSLQAEALGQPGQRRFRVLVQGPGGSAIIWLEKEELHNLAISIGRLLEVLAEEVPQRKAQRSVPTPARSGASLDFKAGSWTLGYDEDRDVVEFSAEQQEDDSSVPKLRFWATREQCRALSEGALTIYGAGRPLCPLCGVSLNPGEPHTCVRSNGHGPITTA